LYGRSIAFRRYIADKGKHYMMSIPKDEQVWLSNPLDTEGQIADNILATSVQDIAQSADYESINIRYAERGALIYEHAFVPIWTVNKSAPPQQREANANTQEVSKHEMAVQRAERYFVERTIQDCKSELGWDELQAQKYPAYMHTMAICAVALVFMASVKLRQRTQYQQADIVQKEIGIEQLPDLSLANVKELMRAVMPLPQLTEQQATKKVINTLFKRSKSTASRRRKQKKRQKILNKNRT